MSDFHTPNNNDSDSNFSRKKRRKTGNESHAVNESGPIKWRTEPEQKIYSTKLIDALRRIRRPDSTAATGQLVRDAADKVLAVSAKGKTRWSRAILKGRLSLRLAQINRKHKRAVRPVENKKPGVVVVKRNVNVVEKKVKVLSKLVPGCGKVSSLPNLLEETTDYIAALEMQVKAMTFLAGLLNGAGASAGGGFNVTGSNSN